MHHCCHEWAHPCGIWHHCAALCCALGCGRLQYCHKLANTLGDTAPMRRHPLTHSPDSAPRSHTCPLTRRVRTPGAHGSQGAGMHAQKQASLIRAKLPACMPLVEGQPHEQCWRGRRAHQAAAAAAPGHGRSKEGARGAHQGVLVGAAQLAEHHDELDLRDVLIAQAVVGERGAREYVATNGDACRGARGALGESCRGAAYSQRCWLSWSAATCMRPACARRPAAPQARQQDAAS